jgi:hypothetical protein
MLSTFEYLLHYIICGVPTNDVIATNHLPRVGDTIHVDGQFCDVVQVIHDVPGWKIPVVVAFDTGKDHRMK